MANTAKKSPIKSTNLWTDVLTIVIGIALGVSGFFYVVPDLVSANDIGANVSDLIAAVKAGSWGAVLSVAIKLWNIATHLFKDKA